RYVECVKSRSGDRSAPLAKAKRGAAEIGFVRAALCEFREPLDEFPLPVMALPDVGESSAEVGGRASLVRERAQIGEQARGIVVAFGIALHDLGLDLAPDGISAPCQRIDPNALSSRLLFCFPPLLGGLALLLGAFAFAADFSRAGDKLS